MKIVLKGDRNTGKTCLFNRMAGKPFQEAYIPTMEIQVSPVSIQFYTCLATRQALSVLLMSASHRSPVFYGAIKVFIKTDGKFMRKKIYTNGLLLLNF